MIRNGALKTSFGRVASVCKCLLWVGFILILTQAVLAGPEPTPKAPKGPKGKGVPDKKVEAKKPAAPKAPTAKAAPTADQKKAAESKVALEAASTHKIQINARHVYLGRYRMFRKPAVLDTQKVFEAISYYRDVKRGGLTKKNGRYWILIQKSNRIFHKALKRLARQEGYDLIGARDAIVIDGNNPTDVTESLISLIPSINLD